MINDTELLRQYSERHSEQAFAALVQRYLNLVYFAALRRTNGDTHLAEDITQQVFATLATNAATLHRHAVLTGWLYVTTRHAAANAMRTEQRRLNREQEVHVMQESQTTRDPEADWNQLRPQLDHAIDELNEHDRLAVLLRFFENRPFAEIGATLRVSEDAARVRVDRALNKLRTLLVRRGITSTAGALAVALSGQSVLAAPPALVASVTGFALTSTAAVTAGGTSTAVSLLHFMSTTKTIIATTSALAAVALGTALYEVRETHQAQAALAAYAKENTLLRARQQQEEKRSAEIGAQLLAAETLNTSLQKTIDEAARKTSAQAKPTTATRTGRNAQFEILAASPEFMELDLKQFRNSLSFKYGLLYHKLDLTPQQIADFETAMVEQHQASMDIEASTRAQGLSSTDPRLSLLNNSVNKTMQDKLRAALGDAGYEKYQVYARTSYARNSVDSIANAFYSTNDPLTAKQADQLTQLVIANTQQPPVDATGVAPRSSTTTDWENVATQATGTLSPAQIDSLRTVVERNRIQRQIGDLANKLINGTNTTPSGTGSAQAR